MFELRGAEPGKAGMRPLVHVPDGSSYNNAMPYAIPTGAYEDMSTTPPYEIRLGSQGRGIWVKPQLPNEHIPRPGMHHIYFILSTGIDSSESRRRYDTSLPACHGSNHALPWKALLRLP